MHARAMYVSVCSCEGHGYVAWAVQSAAGKGRGGDAGVKEGGMPLELQLPHPHSHFSAHEWGEGCVFACKRSSHSFTD